jgi:hypothetical protein
MVLKLACVCVAPLYTGPTLSFHWQARTSWKERESWASGRKELWKERKKESSFFRGRKLSLSPARAKALSFAQAGRHAPGLSAWQSLPVGSKFWHTARAFQAVAHAFLGHGWTFSLARVFGTWRVGDSLESRVPKTPGRQPGKHSRALPTRDRNPSRNLQAGGLLCHWWFHRFKRSHRGRSEVLLGPDS